MTSSSRATGAPQRVAVWNTAFLGDAVLTLPLLKILRSAQSEVLLDFYVRPGLASLFEALPGVRVTEVPRKGFLRFLLQVVRPRRHDLWLGAHPSPRAALAALSSGARRRVGYSGGVRCFGYNRQVPRRFAELDEIERLLQLLRPVQKGYPGFLPGDFDPDDKNSPDHWPELILPDSAEHFAQNFWETHNLAGKPVLGVHPGSVWPTKRWGGFADVARMAADWGATLLVFGGPGEEVTASAVAAAAEPTKIPVATLSADPAAEKTTGMQAGGEGVAQVYDLGGKLSLPQLAACIKRLTVYVGNDSGPLHLAWVQGTPVTAIFGPTVRELGFFPRALNARQVMVHEIELPCRPCGLHGSKACPLGHHHCMKLVTPQRVWDSVRHQLESNLPGKDVSGKDCFVQEPTPTDLEQV